MLKGQQADDSSDVVRVSDGNMGATVAVSINGDFVDVVVIEGVSSSDLSSDGLILA